jgi:hypothetical protein
MADLFLGGSAIDRWMWGLLGLDEQPSDGMMKPLSSPTETQYRSSVE